MGYLYLLCVALMFSFGGTFVRLIKPYYSSSYITWFRFLMGVSIQAFHGIKKHWSKR